MAHKKPSEYKPWSLNQYRWNGSSSQLMWKTSENQNGQAELNSFARISCSYKLWAKKFFLNPFLTTQFFYTSVVRMISNRS